MMKVQNYSNHTKWNPFFHFVVMPLLTLNLIEHVVRVFTSSEAERWDQGFWALFSVVLILLAISIRLMILTVQDRVIRLEERLRYREILDPEIAVKAAELPIGQTIALRFASNEELGTLIERVLAGELRSPKEIKMAVKDWKGDYLRA
jgi:hypothetical protein